MTTNRIVLRAPSDGTVVQKNAVEGTRISAGTEVSRPADLSRVWVHAEVFERGLGRVAVGQGASVTPASYLGEAFSGLVTYVDPTTDPEPRTARVRIELGNPRLRIEPGMYAQVELRALSGQEALVIPRSVRSRENADTFLLTWPRRSAPEVGVARLDRCRRCGEHGWGVYPPGVSSPEPEWR